MPTHEVLWNFLLRRVVEKKRNAFPFFLQAFRWFGVGLWVVTFIGIDTIFAYFPTQLILVRRKRPNA